jgi:hypothetical protein
MFPSWGIPRELAVQDCPCDKERFCSKAAAKVQKKGERWKVEGEKFLLFNYFLWQSTHYVRENA